MNKEDTNIEKLIEHLDAKWGKVKCPMCNDNGFTVSNKVYELREFHGGDLNLGRGSIFPVIPVSCNNCGNSIMINALMSGTIAPSEKKIKAKGK